jgi:predicted TIM-barrel fold metal-dependent hydrolase
MKTIHAFAWTTCVLLHSGAMAQQLPDPIIDMHLHALAANSQGPPPLSFCAQTEFPPADTGSGWPAIFGAWMKNPPCSHPIQSPMTDSELMVRTLAILKRRNITAVTSGSLVDRWKKEAGDRIIPGFMFGLTGPRVPTVDEMRTWFKTGRYAVLGEVTTQYTGIEPSDPRLEPYLALAEEMDIPVGIHIGTGPPGSPYLGLKDYRARLHSPLGLEEALLRHPKLRVYAMHAGWPMLDDMLAMLWTHPQLYVDVGVISFVLPRAAFQSYLQRIVEAGFGKRVLFGSDQMVWPEAIEVAIESIESADFLQPEQKRDILYNNAARFLRLSPEQISRHHGK